MNTATPRSAHGAALPARAAFFTGLLFLGLLLIAGRLVQLQYMHHPVYQRRVERQQASVIKWQAWRGSILDATGRPLALSTAVSSCAVDPQIAIQKGALEKVLVGLSEILVLSPREIQLLRERATRTRPGRDGEPARPFRFVWVRRHLTSEEHQRIQEAKLPGVSFIIEYKRIFPQGNLASHVLGFGNIDGKGLEGIEKAVNQLIRGTEKKVRIERDAINRPLVSTTPNQSAGHEGMSVKLTIDSTIQGIAEKELSNAVEGHNASSGCALVLDPYTGDLLAMANYPTFDPNSPAASPAGNRLNAAVATIQEPGSTFKAFVLAAALQESKVSLGDSFYCENGAWPMPGGRVLHDSHGYGRLTAEMVLVKSSNIGIAKIAARLGPAKLCDYVKRFGFGVRSSSIFTGEQPGMVHPLRKWTSYSMGSVPMGQEIAVTPIQLALAYCTIANGGSLPTPRIIKSLHESDGKLVEAFPAKMRRRVLRPEVAAVMRQVLRKVVTIGTAKRAQMKEYSIAGKTGTAQLPVNTAEYAAGQRGYSSDRYVSNFVGIAPAEVPRIVVVVSIREPKGSHYGGTVSAPAVKEICRRGLLYMRVPKNTE